MKTLPVVTEKKVPISRQYVSADGWNTWDTSSMLSFVHMPEAFQIRLSILDRSENIPVRDKIFVSCLDESPITVRTEPRSWDGSYIEMQVSYAHTVIRIRSTIKDGELILEVTPLEQGMTPAILFTEIGILWNRDGILAKSCGRMTGTFETKTFHVYTDGCQVHYPYSFTSNPCIALELNRTTIISTCECTAAEAAQLLDQAHRHMLKDDLQKYGDLAEPMQAMRTCMAWSTVYEPEEDCVCTPVSRLANYSSGGYVLFPWDGFFTALMISTEKPELAKQNTVALLNGILEEGFLPNYHAAGKAVQADRSNPPVGSMCCMDIYRRSPDLSYLQDIFPVLLRWNEWFSENRMTPEGYLSWGSGPAVKQYGKKYEAYGVHTTEGATYESGMDLASIYADVPFCEETSTMYLADMALMGIYVTDCRALLEMAVLLGEDGSRIRQRMQLVERAIRSMWNESMGVYANLRLDTGKFSKAVGPTCFCALFADGIPKENAGRMILEWLLPETRLGGTYPLPTVSRDDVGFTPEKTLFRGRIWPPVCYLAFRALRRGGFTKEASSVSERLLNMFLKEWREHRHIHCNHDPATGSGELPASVAYYTWGALYAYMAWEERNS